MEIKYQFERLIKTVQVHENSIIPSYGDKVNEFNEFMKVINVENVNGVIEIKLEKF